MARNTTPQYSTDWAFKEQELGRSGGQELYKREVQTLDQCLNLQPEINSEYTEAGS